MARIKKAIRKKRRENNIPRGLRGLSAQELRSEPFARFNCRKRKATERVAQANARIQEQLFTIGFPRQRRFVSVQNLFKFAKVQDPEKIIIRKVMEKGSCTVFDIGAGIGAALGTAMTNERILPIHDKIKLIGMDVLQADPKMEKLTGVKMIAGNALTTPFPKADLIFSQVTAGYIGHIGILVRKTGNALNNKGIAVLHINKHGIARTLQDYDGVNIKQETLIKKIRELGKNIKKIRISNCKIRVVRGEYEDNNFPQYYSKDDLAIVIEKE